MGPCFQRKNAQVSEVITLSKGKQAPKADALYLTRSRPRWATFILTTPCLFQLYEQGTFDDLLIFHDADIVDFEISWAFHTDLHLHR